MIVLLQTALTNIRFFCLAGIFLSNKKAIRLYYAIQFL